MTGVTPSQNFFASKGACFLPKFLEVLDSFIDFLLSTQAQRMMQAAEYFPSNPNVDPAPSLRMIVPRNAGIPSLTLTSERLNAMTPKSVELYRRYFR